MKKVLITSILILAIISSLLAGTVSYYTTSVDNLAGGSVTAKEFIFLGEGSQSFTHSEAIAPSETVEWSFKVRNFKDSTVTETDQYYKLNIDVTNADGKEAIQPLQVTITDQSGKEHSVTGTGSFSILDDFPIKTDGQEHEYQVTMYWPSGDNDIDYAGNGFGNSVKVSAIASQVPFDSETKPVEPEEPGEPGEGEGADGEMPDYAENVRITYSTTVPGGGFYEFFVVIENHGDEAISDWELSFKLDQTIGGSG
ncbi:MAG TPA: sugar-binding protein, partial [Clostridia bacterium]|nr:sugar-binding protein [Clostridia bacterium]